jgi:hypothetical protein
MITFVDPFWWKAQLRPVLLAVLALLSAHAMGNEVLFACKFELSALPVIDKDAKPWHDDRSFRERSFVMQMDPPKIVDGPKPTGFWGEPTVRMEPQELRIEWRIKANPSDRWPKITLIVNRFSGQAFEIYSMLQSPNKGPEYAYWSRNGHCEIHKKKL